MGVADLGEAESLRALDELIERHLLREEAGGREAVMPLDPTPTYTFTHEKIRQVAYTEAGPARRRLLHHRAFEVLEEGGASSCAAGAACACGRPCGAGLPVLCCGGGSGGGSVRRTGRHRALRKGARPVG